MDCVPNGLLSFADQWMIKPWQSALALSCWAGATGGRRREAGGRWCLDGNPRFVDDPNTEDCLQAPGTCGDPPIVDIGAFELRTSSGDAQQVMQGPTWTTRYYETKDRFLRWFLGKYYKPATKPRMDDLASIDTTGVFFGGQYIHPIHMDPHYLICGSTGSGKTWTLRMLMKSVLFDEEGRLKARALVYDPKNELYKVFLLSSPDDPKTMELKGPIPNDLESKTGQPTAFTMGQRYVAVEKLAKAKTTSDLV